MASKAQTYRFDVVMTCSGCSGAVERALKRVEGVKADVNLDAGTVTVEDLSGVGAETVLSKIQKTGKKVNRWDSGDGKGWREVS